MSGAELLGAEGLDVAVPGRRLVAGLTLGVAAGEFLCVLGANGAGKSLTLHTLAGLRAPAAGRVRLAGRALGEWPRRERARRLGLLTQVSEDPFPGTVLDAVLVGRHPHVNLWNWESEADVAVARAALAACGLAGLEERAIDTLSGGERRRVALAAVLAQDPDVLLLDEPQNHLDPHHQLDVLKLLRARADSGRAVVATLHDPALAARFADQVLLLYGDGRWSCGDTATTLSAAALTEIYQVPVEEVLVGGRRLFLSD
ncbi:MAG: ABC transporter ATP-binding protein [Proteobacteria bacterium]|nr:ABC transporter ATP-binding protein [Pseudomonadota bacterium]